MTLHHLAFRTADVPRLRAFYERLCGLRAVRENESSVWLAAGDAVLMIELRDANEPTVAPGTKELVAFRCGGALEEARALLRVEGVTIEGETEHTVYFRDPDGRRVGLSTHPLMSGSGK